MRIKSYVLATAMIALGLIVVAHHNDTMAQATADDTDRIYKGGEVDKKAVIKRGHSDVDEPSPAGCKGAGRVAFRAVLRKSGKVTNVRVIEKGDCPTFEQRAQRAVEKVRFKPAQKDGQQVSTYMQFEFNYNCHGECP